MRNFQNSFREEEILVQIIFFGGTNNLRKVSSSRGVDMKSTQITCSNQKDFFIT